MKNIKRSTLAEKVLTILDEKIDLTFFQPNRAREIQEDVIKSLTRLAQLQTGSADSDYSLLYYLHMLPLLVELIENHTDHGRLLLVEG